MWIKCMMITIPNIMMTMMMILKWTTRMKWNSWLKTGIFASSNHFSHKCYVHDGQTECFNSRQAVFISKSWYLFSQFVKCRIQVEHSSSFTNVCCSPLSNSCYASSWFISFWNTIYYVEVKPLLLIMLAA